jgi:hypothetical protein
MTEFTTTTREKNSPTARCTETLAAAGSLAFGTGSSRATARCCVVGVLTLARTEGKAPIRDLQVQEAPWGLRQTEQLSNPGDDGRCCRRWVMQGVDQDNRNGRPSAARQFVVLFDASGSHIAVTACRGRIDCAGQILPEASTS